MEERVKELSKYRLESSFEALDDARIMYENGRYKNALNRAYYCVFHAIRAVNTLKGFDSSKHSGVIAYFNQNFVKEGVFSKDLSKIIRIASESREKADYLDFFVASKEEAEKQIARAEEFVSVIEEYLMSNGVCQNSFKIDI